MHDLAKLHLHSAFVSRRGRHAKRSQARLARRSGFSVFLSRAKFGHGLRMVGHVGIGFPEVCRPVRTSGTPDYKTRA